MMFTRLLLVAFFALSVMGDNHTEAMTEAMTESAPVVTEAMTEAMTEAAPVVTEAMTEAAPVVTEAMTEAMTEAAPVVTEAVTEKPPTAAPTAAPTITPVTTAAPTITPVTTPSPTAAPTMADVATEAMTEAMTEPAPVVTEVATEAAGDDMTEVATEAAGDDMTEAAGDDMTEAAGDDMTEAAPVTFTVSGELSLGYPSVLSDDEIATEEANVEANLALAFAGTADCTMTADAGAQRRMLEVAYTAAFTVAGVSAERTEPGVEEIAMFSAAVGAGSAFNLTVAVGEISAVATTEAPSASPTATDTSSAQHCSLSFGFLTLLMSLIINW